MRRLPLLAVLLLAAPAGAAKHKLSVTFVDGEVIFNRSLAAEEMKQADSAPLGTPAVRPLLVSAVVSREEGGVHLVEYQLLYDDRELGRTFTAQGALTLARGERAQVISCGDYVLELGLDAKGGALSWPAGDASNHRLTAQFARAGRKLTCRTVTRLGTQLNLDMGSGAKERRTTFRFAQALSGAGAKLALEYNWEDVLAGGAKLSLEKREPLVAGSEAIRDGQGYELSWLAEPRPPKRAAAKPAAAAAPEPKVYKPVPRPRLQSTGGIGINNLSGGGGSAPTATVAPTIPIPELPAAKPQPQPEDEEEASEE